ncbi:MAG: amidoligase family protein [Anaeroplasmataceae bacterium]
MEAKNKTMSNLYAVSTILFDFLRQNNRTIVIGNSYLNVEFGIQRHNRDINLLNVCIHKQHKDIVGKSKIVSVAHNDKNDGIVYSSLCSVNEMYLDYDRMYLLGNHDYDNHCTNGEIHKIMSKRFYKEDSYRALLGYIVSLYKFEYMEEEHGFSNLFSGQVRDNCLDEEYKQTYFAEYTIERIVEALNTSLKTNLTIDEILESRICDCCGQFHKDDNKYCESCINSAKACPTCGELIFNNSKELKIKGEIKCSHCIRKSDGVGVWADYSDKKTPVFYGEGNYTDNFFFGCEIEVEKDFCEEYNRTDCSNVIANYNEHLYFKTDGSLQTCDGFEIITHPCTIDYHKEFTTDSMNILKELGYESDSMSTCGLHIHVSKKIYKDLDKPRDYYLDKLLSVCSQYSRELHLLSNRGLKTSYCGFPTIPKISCNNEEILSLGVRKEFIKMSNDDNDSISDYNWLDMFYHEDSRYRALNLKNDATIEYRLPQGTLNGDMLLVHLQTFDRLLKIVREDIDTSNVSFDTLFYSFYPELDNHIDTVL